MPHKDPEMARLYYASYRQLHREHYRLYDRARTTTERKEQAKAIKRRRRMEQPDKTRNIRLKEKFGIDLEEYNRLHMAQSGLCAICHQPETIASRGTKINYLAVDHDHVTGKIRGLLCSRCNTAIGLMEDNTTRLTSAINYLEKTMSLVSHPSNLPKQPDLTPEGKVPAPTKGQPQPYPGYSPDSIKKSQG